MMNIITRSLKNSCKFDKKQRSKTIFLVNRTIYSAYTWLLACVSRKYSFIDKKNCFRSLFFVKIASMFKLLVIVFIIRYHIVLKHATQEVLIFLIRFIV